MKHFYNIKGVFFDLDGTLLDSVGDIHAAVNQMLELASAEPMAMETVTNFVGKGSSNLVKRVIEAAGLKNDASSHARYLAEFLDIYTAKPASLTTVFDNVHKVLRGFQDSGVALGLCTNKPEAPTKNILEQFGLDAFFKVVVGGDRLPNRKPDPSMLYLVMKELAVDQCLFVGDSEVDVATAKAAGVPVALHTRGYRRTPVAELCPDFYFGDYADLPFIANQCFSTFK